MRLSLLLFKPLIALFNGTAFLVMRLLGLNSDHSHSHVHSPEELEGLFRASAAGGLIDVAERDMVAGVLNIEDRVVREIMTPRTRIVSVRHDLDVRSALRKLAGTPYTRFPVVGNSVDDLRGMVSLRRLYQMAEVSANVPVSQVMTRPIVVADAMPVDDLWRKLSEMGKPNAVVVDEYGGVAGLVTLEDALEEIFGEMQDEFDQEEELIVQSGGRITARGDVLLEVLNDRYSLNLPAEEIDTVSGLVWSELGRLPTVDDQVVVGDLVLLVESMDKRAVGRVSFDLPRPSDVTDSNATDSGETVSETAAASHDSTTAATTLRSANPQTQFQPDSPNVVVRTRTQPTETNWLEPRLTGPKPTEAEQGENQ